MTKLFTPLFLLLSASLNAQVLCGTADEGGTVTLTAPVGNVFTSIEFASYGTPNGSCGSFTIGACHEPNSVSIVEGVFLGQNSASIDADNGVFGDPCGGTFKRLYIQARYSSILPVTLLSFTARKTSQDQVRLDWTTGHEINASLFVIERSRDGILFDVAGSVPATGAGHYSFTNTISNGGTYLYRLKMLDRDTRFRYSNIVRVSATDSDVKLAVFPNPAKDLITIVSNKKQEATVMSGTGKILRQISLISGSQTLNISGWAAGVYFIKHEEAVIKFIKN